MSEKKSIMRRIIEEKEKKKKEEEERNRLRRKIEEWRQMGWKTYKLEEMVENESIENIREEMARFEEGMRKLREIGKGLDKFDRMLYEKDLIPIETKLNDPYLLPEIEKMYNNLLKKLEEEKKEAGKEKIDLSIEITNYFNALLEKFENHKPDYGPIEGYMRDSRWDVKFDRENKIITGILSKKLSKKLIIECGLHTKKILEEELSLQADNAFRKKIFVAKCYVVATADDKIKKLFEKYTHMNFSPYLYVIKSNEIIFNKNDFKSNIFSFWFKKDSEPKNMVEILKEIFNGNLFSIEDVEYKMGMKKEKATKMINELMKEYKIMEVEKGKYALVD